MRITCMQTVSSSQILILQLLQILHFVSAHCTCHSSVHVISLSYISIQERDTSALLPDSKAKDCNGCVNHVHDDIATFLQCS